MKRKKWKWLLFWKWVLEMEMVSPEKQLFPLPSPHQPMYQHIELYICADSQVSLDCVGLRVYSLRGYNVVAEENGESSESLCIKSILNPIRVSPRVLLGENNIILLAARKQKLKLGVQRPI